MGRVEHVNVGQVETFAFGGSTFTSAIRKRPVAGPVTVHAVRVGDDQQADLRFHGGEQRAVYAYAIEDLDWWTEQRADAPGGPPAPGRFGENLTVSGIDCSGAVAGTRWQVGPDVVLEVTSPRVPCFKLGWSMGDEGFLREMRAAHRPGAYLRVVVGGEVRAGDAIVVGEPPAHGITMALLHRAAHKDLDAAELARLRAASDDLGELAASLVP